MTSTPKVTLQLRKAARYVRSDIKAELYSNGLFRSSTPFAVELLDISTRGAHIASERKLRIKGAYTLKLTFEGGQTFEIAGKVIHKKAALENEYGFQFNAYNDSLGDYLLETQTDLIFK